MSHALLVLAQSDWNHHNDVGDGWWIVMIIGMAAFWVFVAVAVVWALRRSSAKSPADDDSRADGERPLQILERRLAEGEISIEEYARRRELLTRGPDGPGAGQGADG